MTNMTYIVVLCLKDKTEEYSISLFFFLNSRNTCVYYIKEYCATYCKVGGSIPDGVIGIFH
jgi:uncharacterized protein YhbP (UPF0306 family)